MGEKINTLLCCLSLPVSVCEEGLNVIVSKRYIVSSYCLNEVSYTYSRTEILGNKICQQWCI